MHPLTDEFKLGTCEWCGEEGEIYADNSLCADCDRDITHCSICKEDQHIDSACRHVFQDQGLEWTGSGGYAPSDEVKKSFIRLISSMPEGFAPDLRQAIAAEKFHTWFIGPLIGPSGILTLYGTKNSREWGDQIVAFGEGEQAEIYEDGYYWLASLYNDDTPEANQITIGWIDEFIKSATVVPLNPKGA